MAERIGSVARDLRDARVMVTGGAGFLARRMVAKLEKRGAEPLVILCTDYDLTDPERVKESIAEREPRDRVHAAVVGGSGANRAQPLLLCERGRWASLIQEAWRARVDKRVVGTICAYPKYTEVSTSRGGHLDRLPGGIGRSVQPGKKMLHVQ